MKRATTKDFLTPRRMFAGGFHTLMSSFADTKFSTQIVLGLIKIIDT